jgi:hypothetical protein
VARREAIRGGKTPSTKIMRRLGHRRGHTGSRRHVSGSINIARVTSVVKRKRRKRRSHRR